MIIDAHTHIYPGKIAHKASDSIGDFYDIHMSHDGTVETLLARGDACGVNGFLIHSVATRPEQVAHINDFIAGTVRSNPDRFIGFCTLHPDLEGLVDEVERAIAMGLRGVKLHPDFQRFAIDDKRAYPIYELCEGRLPILFHTGDPRHAYSNPHRVPQLLRDFPKLRLICAHLGGWSEWDEAKEYLTHERVWVDTSSSSFALPCEKMKELILNYGTERVLFGSDYPMWDVGDEIAMIHSLNLGEAAEKRIFAENLLELLALPREK